MYLLLLAGLYFTPVFPPLDLTFGMWSTQTPRDSLKMEFLADVTLLPGEDTITGGCDALQLTNIDQGVFVLPQQLAVCFIHVVQPEYFFYSLVCRSLL